MSLNFALVLAVALLPLGLSYWWGRPGQSVTPPELPDDNQGLGEVLECRPALPAEPEPVSTLYR